MGTVTLDFLPVLHVTQAQLIFNMIEKVTRNDDKALHFYKSLCKSLNWTIMKNFTKAKLKIKPAKLLCSFVSDVLISTSENLILFQLLIF